MENCGSFKGFGFIYIYIYIYRLLFFFFGYSGSNSYQLKLTKMYKNDEISLIYINHAQTKLTTTNQTGHPNFPLLSFNGLTNLVSVRCSCAQNGGPRFSEKFSTVHQKFSTKRRLQNGLSKPLDDSLLLLQ